MRADHVFGFLLILLAIYLGVTAAYGGVDRGLPGPRPGPVELAPGGGGGRDDMGRDHRDGEDRDRDDEDRDDEDRDDEDRDDRDRDDRDRDDRDRRQKARESRQERTIANSDFCAAAPQTSQFDDLGTAHDEAIRCMEEAGVVTGETSTQFDPAEAVTRGQAAMAIAALMDTANSLEAEGVDLQDLPSADAPRFEDFKDSGADCPGQLAIARLNETPVAQGYVDSRFEPCGNVTRGQMASLLDRTYQYLNRSALPTGPDLFRDDDTSVHEESINAVAAAEIMEGRGNQRFMPRQSVLRGQMASHLALILIRMEDKGRIVPLP